MQFANDDWETNTVKLNVGEVYARMSFTHLTASSHNESREELRLVFSLQQTWGTAELGEFFICPESKKTERLGMASSGTCLNGIYKLCNSLNPVCILQSHLLNIWNHDHDISDNMRPCWGQLHKWLQPWNFERNQLISHNKRTKTYEDEWSGTCKG